MFEQFWKVYPRKVSKGAALKAWNKIKPDMYFAEKIIRAVVNQKNYRERVEKSNDLLPRWQRTFLPNWKHPATWLNQQCWDDEVPETGTTQPIEKKWGCAACSYEGKDVYPVSGKFYCIRCYDKKAHPENYAVSR